MADVSTDIEDSDSQEVITSQQLIAERELYRMKIAIIDQQLAKVAEKLKLQQEQSSESEGSSPEVNVQKASEERPLEHQKSHRASAKKKMEPLPPAERGQSDDRSPEWPHWDRRQQDENVFGKPPHIRSWHHQAHWRDQTRVSWSDSEDGSPWDWYSSDAEDSSEMESPPTEYQDDNLQKKQWREYSGGDGRQRDRFDRRFQDCRGPHERYRYLPPAEGGQAYDRSPEWPHWDKRQDENVYFRPPQNRRVRHQAHRRYQTWKSYSDNRLPLPQEILTLDSIDITTYHLERTELLKNVTTILQHHQFLLFTSPAASGKTSLSKIIEHDLGIPCIYLSCSSPFFSTLKLLKAEGRDEFYKPFKLREINYECIVMLDDAHVLYHEKKFWRHLVKAGSWCFPLNIHFVIAATHMLTGGRNASPGEFQSLQRLSRADFLLSKQEAKQFLNSPIIGLQDVMRKPNLIKLIIRDCAGLVGALRIAVDALKTRFAEVPLPSEADLLSYYLSAKCVTLMAHCFGSQHSSPIRDDFGHFLTRCFLGNPMQSPNQLDKKDKQCLDSLQEMNLLIKMDNNTFEFASPLARRFYSQWLFPHRLFGSQPVSLVDLVKKVIEDMSASVLQQSTVDGNDFPKEATFQHLWMHSLAQFTLPTCSICPELSKIFPCATTNSTSKIEDEIDFYLNGDLHWGIVLLVNGNGITEDIDRFGKRGKYFPLSVNDYAIVDFHHNKSGQATNIDSHPKRITVFFKSGDFSKCQCLFGLNETPLTLTLRP